MALMSTFEENIGLPRYLVFDFFTLLTLYQIAQGLMEYRRMRQACRHRKIKENVPVDRTDHRISSFENLTMEKIGHAYFLM
jgi:hypothetical protein